MVLGLYLDVKSYNSYQCKFSVMINFIITQIWLMYLYCLFG